MKRTAMVLIGLAALGIGSYIAFSDVVRPPSRAASTAEPIAGDQAEGSSGKPTNVAGDRAERSSDQPANPDKEAAALRARMARLNAEVAALREQMEESQAAANVGAPAADPEPARRGPEVIAEQEREWHEHMMEVDSGFQSEARDPRWASTTTSALESALNASDAMRGKARSVECRSLTCRVEIADDGSGAMAKEIPIFVQQFAETLPGMQADHFDDGSGNRTLVLYMTRDDGAQ